MVIYFTGSLRNKLRMPDLGVAEEEFAPHLQWYANLFTAQRIQYIVTTNAASLFSVIIPGRGVTDDDRYLKAFLGSLREDLKHADMDTVYSRILAPQIGSIIVANAGNQSVLQSMNSIVGNAKRILERENLGPPELAERLNDRPVKSLKFRTPKEVFAALYPENAAR